MIEWREEDHPRVPAGNPEGGQFTEKASAEARRAAGLKMGAMTEVNASKDFYENTIRVMNLLDKDANVGSFIDYEYVPWE